MQENLTLARPYAQAVYKQAEEQGAFGGWSAALALLAAVVEHPDMQRVINDPRMDDDRLAELIVSLGDKTLFPAARNFVHVLVQAERLAVAPEIAALYEQMRASAEGVRHLEVSSAHPLSDEERRALAAALEKRLGAKVDLKDEVDESLIGGVVIRDGDRVIDASVRGRLRELALRLA
ncbi:F0F1 ATP synthase subunit delta [Hydrogenophaga sp.]|uniref:F0F1 ATP synthase subunit delta n=1 Tax=Hydrogenophaga sp. TaxID=1904254 RepID=UPI00262AA2D2|nr:F0F1 ATP synthase subunit delta [Hydrogenophaga sp.]MCW5655984.1 F0F1 ATP synthase subunit delta [Hydrogenophaga sp.]